MRNFWEKLAKGESVTDQDMQQELYEICDNAHASCGCECPVFEKNNGPVNPDKSLKENRGCNCFRSGKKMLAFLRT